MKNKLIFAFLLFIHLAHAAPIWQREIVNYDRLLYKAGFQNWMITQSENGWIYAANTAGLLEFDGVKWSLYKMKRSMVRSVLSVNNKVYAGGSAEFGYFEPNEIGKLTYTSLSQNIPKWGGEVWNTLQMEKKIYFISDNNVHIYNQLTGKIETIDCESKINSSVVFDNEIILGTSNGLAYLTKENEIRYIDYSKDVASYKIIQLLFYRNKLLVVTAKGGIYSLEDNKLIKKYSKADIFIRDNQLFSATLSGSLLILGSVQNGVYMVDLENESYSEHINIENGIMNNTILNVYIDQNEGLWLSLDKGISYINLNSPIRPLYSNISPIGTGHCSIIYNEKVYFGTNQGVYTLDESGKYQLIAETEGQIWSMDIIDDKLFCSGDNNITIISPKEHYNLNVNSAWEVHQIKHEKNKIIVGTYSGFEILVKRNGKWKHSHGLSNIFSSMRGFIEDDEPYTFWNVKFDEQVTKITLDSTLSHILKEKTYDITGELLHNNKCFRKIDNNITIATDSGLYYYSRLLDRYMKYTQLEEMLDGSGIYKHLSIDNLGSIWYSTNKTMKMLPYSNGSYANEVINVGPIIDKMTDNYQNIFRIDSIESIIATDNGFSKINLKKNLTTTISSMQTYIRRLLSSKNDSIISYGNNSAKIEIPYTDNSIKIEYSATAFSNDLDIKYIFRLKDKDESWSIPTRSTSKEYTRLFEGSYVFEVKAINEIDGKYGDVASLTFTILPPWYRSLYAYFTYMLLFCLIMYISYRLTLGKQKEIINKQKYESEIKDQEIYELQNKSLKDELYYKTQELSGYILNIIRKNEMLEDVKKRAIGVSKALDEEDSRPVIKQKITRLISQIDINIDKDKEFEIFKSNFDIVHQDFFKQLDEKIPNLTRNDKILCAYLNMNLSSKEIAPLLNISVRGVEVSRYRLRKKMELDRDNNLIEYLQNL